jgi:hypothetical protein
LCVCQRVRLADGAWMRRLTGIAARLGDGQAGSDVREQVLRWVA